MPNTITPTTPPSQRTTPSSPPQPQRQPQLRQPPNHLPRYANCRSPSPHTKPQPSPLMEASLRSKRNQGFQKREGETKGTPMARGFSRLIFPPAFPTLWCGGRAIRVKGHVKEGPHFEGMNLPVLGPSNDSLGPRAPRGEGARGSRPFSRSFPPELEVGRSDKQGGARHWN